MHLVHKTARHARHGDPGVLMSVERLLQAAVKAGGQELRLTPGRRIVIVTPAGEREVQGAGADGARASTSCWPAAHAEAPAAPRDRPRRLEMDVPGRGRRAPPGPSGRTAGCTRRFVRRRQLAPRGPGRPGAAAAAAAPGRGLRVARPRARGERGTTAELDDALPR